MQRLAVDEKLVPHAPITSEIEVEFPSEPPFESMWYLVLQCNHLILAVITAETSLQILQVRAYKMMGKSFFPERA